MYISNVNTTLTNLLRQRPTKQAYIVTDRNVSTHCLPLLDTSIQSLPTLILPAGEENKDIRHIQRIWDFLLDQQATRQALLINIGGGVITDMGGFAAATYKRGIDFINIPTTLLAMVDAAYGGKTGCNYRDIKNCIGTFTTPLCTIIDPTFLPSLSPTQWLSGYAEMLKHALISTPQHWNGLCTYDLNQRDIHALTPLLNQSISVKQQIIQQDPDEQNIRRTLNFGHTIGHALEAHFIAQAAQQHTDTPPHGYCVLWGMIAELYLSVILLDCPRQPLQQLTSIMLEYYGKPSCNCQQQDDIITYMLQDKKNTTTTPDTDSTLIPDTPHINFTLLCDIGQPLINQTPTLTDIRQALDYLFSI